MNPEALDLMKKNAEAATPGPWNAARPKGYRTRWFVQGVGLDWGDICETANLNREANAAHIASSGPDNVLALIAENEALRGAWDWLATRVNLSLEYDWPDEEEHGAWQVHRVSGNVNDREWELVGSGPTPLEAFRAARAVLHPQSGEA